VTEVPRWRRSRAWRELRPYAGLALGLAGYAILRVVFAHVAGSRGVVTPSGSASQGLVALAVVMLAARLAVLFLVPLLLVYRLVRRLAPRGGSGGPAGGEPAADLIGLHQDRGH
jgi:hypothetical protein